MMGREPLGPPLAPSSSESRVIRNEQIAANFGENSQAWMVVKSESGPVTWPTGGGTIASEGLTPTHGERGSRSRESPPLPHIFLVMRQNKRIILRVRSSLICGAARGPTGVMAFRGHAVSGTMRQRADACVFLWQNRRQERGRANPWRYVFRELRSRCSAG
jgi:hypothetical protein